MYTKEGATESCEWIEKMYYVDVDSMCESIQDFLSPHQQNSEADSYSVVVRKYVNHSPGSIPAIPL